MDNKKKLTLVLALLAVVCVFAVLVFSGILDFGELGGEEPTTEDINTSVSEDINYTAKTTVDATYLKTPVDGIFYSVTTDGTVKFWKLENNAFTAVEATGTYTATVTLSEEEITADITYLETEDDICGYGLYTSEDGAYALTPYAFFYLRDYGENYESASSSGGMLFVDTTADDFYSDEKVYEESFFYNYSSAAATRSLSEASRTIGMDGAKRSDYFVITDKVVDGSTEHQLFLSGRFYSEADEKVDLFRSGGSGNNTDNIRLANDILGYWAEYTEDGIKYVSVDENDNVAVMLLNEDEDEAVAVKTFENVKRDDVLVNGDYIYVASQSLLYSINDNTEVKINTGYSNYYVDMFEIDGDTLMLRGYVDRLNPAIVVASASTGEVKKAVQNEIFRMFVAATVENGQVIAHVQNSDKFDCYIF